MKKIHIILASAFCLFAAGCDDFLDEKPKELFIPYTIQHYEGMLNNRHIVALGDMNIDYLTDDASLPEPPEGFQGPPAFNLYTAIGTQTLTARGQNIYKFDPVPYSEGDSEMAWSESHNRLFYYNTVANNILDVKEGTEQQRRSIWAEALLQRAVEHFYLVNLYAMHYDPATADEELGIPIVNKADISAKFERSTVAQTYAHILRDLENARTYLPEKPVANNFRASQAAGFAMTAKVYFTMADYENALIWVEQALAKNSALLDMNNHDTATGWAFGSEAVAHVPGTPVEWSTMPRGIDNPETILNRHNLQPFGLGGSGARVCASPELQALYDQQNDMRWYLWYIDSWPPAGPMMTFMTLYGVRLFLRGDYYNICLGTPEMYLIRAECYARKGELGKALADVNELRRHRLRPEGFEELTPADFGNDNERVLRFVLEERRRELAFTGNRHVDLKRLNKEPRFAKTVIHTVADTEYKLEPNSRYYVRELWPGTTKFNPQWPLNFPELAGQTPSTEE